MRGKIYLQYLFKAAYTPAYFGMMRVREVTEGDHTLKAPNIHIGNNKDKIVVVLYTSKTHGKESYPQKTKITADDIRMNNQCNKYFFCPFQILRQYLAARGDYISHEERFLVYTDRTSVPPGHLRNNLRLLLSRLNLEAQFYDMHSFALFQSWESWRYASSRVQFSQNL